MNLHLDHESFKALIGLASQELGIEEIYIEKDYFVVLALKGLSESDYKKNGILKGELPYRRHIKRLKDFLKILIWPHSMRKAK